MNILEYAKMKKILGGGGGGVTSWNDLTDKPFGEEVTEVGGDTLAWGGDTNGRYVIDLGDTKLVHVSDAVPTLDDFKNGAAVEYGTNRGQSYTQEDIIGGSTANGIIVTDFFVIVPYDNYTEDDFPFVFEKKGIYVYQHNGAITLTIYGYEGFITRKTVVKPLDEKYLPESVEGMVLRSSTAGSAKKFKLTVDDSGTISATEVTS